MTARSIRAWLERGRRPAIATAAGVALLAGLVLTACRSDAQEFAMPAPAADRSLGALLERGLPPERLRLEAAALAIRWYGVPELDTRAVAAGVGWRSLRLGAGLARAGDPDLGWSALSLAGGAAVPGGGAALRACTRTRLVEPSSEARGIEVGFGAWLEPAARIQVWASAPQLWTAGAAPPLERWLEVGVAAHVSDARAWLARSAAPGAPRGLRAEHVAGLETPLGVAALWLEARDHPPRATFGCAAVARGLRVAAAVESHPVLGETVRLALTWTRGGAP